MSQTDGQTELPWHIRAIAYMLSRVKMAAPSTPESTETVFMTGCIDPDVKRSNDQMAESLSAISVCMVSDGPKVGLHANVTA